MYRARKSTPLGDRQLHWMPLTLVLVVACLAAFPAAATTCEGLTGLALPNNSSVTSATSIVPPFTTPVGIFGGATISVPFCRVIGVSMPTSDSHITFEVWLPPTATWNRRLEGIGDGGYTGTINYPAMAVGLARNYAVANNDLGHTGSTGIFALGHPEKIADWGNRGDHVTAVAAKAIVAAYYNANPTHSYFTGCSNGGHEALMEAQRYPEDYEGFVAGASANYWTHQSTAWVWEEERSGLDNLASIVPPSKLPMVAQAAVAACDALDGVVDGLINDPRQCDFDPATLLCQAGDALTCLTAPQVQAIKEVYQGPVNPRTGQQLYPGLERGGEYGWPGDPGSLGRDFFKDFLFQNPNWDYHALDFDHDIALADAEMSPVIDSINPDLSAFRDRGGKLIMYHGWNDPRVNPRNSINYFNEVAYLIAGAHGRKLGDLEYGNAVRETQSFLRLFMAPGMGHCGGGPGPNAFGGPFGLAAPEIDPEHDMLSALEQWVERGVAPDQIIATYYANNVRAQGISMQRPLCPYPEEAVYTGSGNTNDAANFVCHTPRPPQGAGRGY